MASVGKENDRCEGQFNRIWTSNKVINEWMGGRRITCRKAQRCWTAKITVVRAVLHAALYVTFSMTLFSTWCKFKIWRMGALVISEIQIQPALNKRSFIPIFLLELVGKRSWFSYNFCKVLCLTRVMKEPHDGNIVNQRKEEQRVWMFHKLGRHFLNNQVNLWPPISQTCT